MCQMPECFTHTTPKARKIHQCVECLGLIQKGERYDKLTGIWDGTPATYKTCMDCVAIRCEAMDGMDYEDCIPFGHLHYNLEGSELARFKVVAEARKVPK